MKAKIVGRFEYGPSVGLDCKGDKVVVQQSFKKEADINTIVNKYLKTGFLVNPAIVRTREAMCGDFSSVDDYHTAQIKLVNANKNFMALPVELRTRFNNDPAELIAFLSDVKNEDEAIKLGLLNPKPVDPAVKAKEAKDAIDSQNKSLADAIAFAIKANG